MPLQKLDHVNLRTNQLDVMVEWYIDVLGMRSGPRANFPFPGAWMYVGEAAAVHLVGVEADAGAGAEVPLKMEHFAFSATDRAAFQSKLDSLNLPWDQIDLPDVGITQMNIWDPDGNHIHVDFPFKE